MSVTRKRRGSTRRTLKKQLKRKKQSFRKRKMGGGPTTTKEQLIKNLKREKEKAGFNSPFTRKISKSQKRSSLLNPFGKFNTNNLTESLQEILKNN